MKKLVILQSITPDYRKLFFETIKKNLKEKFQLYGGNSYFEKSLKDDESIDKIMIRNRFLFNRRIMLQSHTLKFIFMDCVLVLGLNPRILTNWIILFSRYLLGKRTLVWGHAWSRNGIESKTGWLRKLMKHLSNGVIVYTNQQKKELLCHMPNTKIYAAPNAVISANDMINESSTNQIKNIIYVGRLTSKKKPFFLVKAFHKVLASLPTNMNLFIVGDGEEKQKIEDYIVNEKISGRVCLKGHISDYNVLKELYSSAIFSISPGYVGLSITQSFGFGVPMMVSKDEPHSPEIELFEENDNGLFFNTDDIDDFGLVLLSVVCNKQDWISKRDNIVKLCKENYSVESMADVFINLVKE